MQLHIRRPLAQWPPISIYPPPPSTGPRASHSWTSGSGRRREQQRLVGTDAEPHPVYPLSSSAPKQELWGGWQHPQDPAGLRRSPLKAGPLSLPTFGGGGRREWRTQCEGAGRLLTPEDLHTHQGSGSDLLYSRQGLVATSSLQVFPVPQNIPPPAHSFGAEPTDTPPTYIYLQGLQTKGPGLELYPTPDRVWETGLHFPIACFSKPSDCWTPQSCSSPFSWDQEELSCPRRQRKRVARAQGLPSLLYPQSSGKGSQGGRGGNPGSSAPIIQLGGGGHDTTHLPPALGGWEEGFWCHTSHLSVFCQSRYMLTLLSLPQSAVCSLPQPICTPPPSQKKVKGPDKSKGWG